MSWMIFATALSPIALAPAQDQPIEGYYWECRVTLQLEGGELTATRGLTDDTHELDRSDWASWSPKDHSQPRFFSSIDWIDPRGGDKARLGALRGRYRIALDADHAMPKVSELEISASGLGIFSPLSLLLARGMDKREAAARIPLGALLAYAAADDRLDWSAIDRAGHDGSQKTLLTGTIAVAPLREAAAAAIRAEAELDRKASTPATSCEREPIYHDPASDI
jgi:hypothetical protein